MPKKKAGIPLFYARPKDCPQKDKVCKLEGTFYCKILTKLRKDGHGCCHNNKLSGGGTTSALSALFTATAERIYEKNQNQY